MRALPFVVLTSALVFAVGAAPRPTPAPPSQGCSARPDSHAEEIMDWGLTIDGEIVSSYRNDDPDREDWGRLLRELGYDRIKSAGVVCWRAVDRMYGVRFRHGIYSVWTVDLFAGSADFLREAYAVRTEGGDVSELPLPRPGMVLTEHPVGDAGGFMLDLTHPKWNRACWISNVREARTDLDWRWGRPADAAPGTPRCGSLHDHGGSGR